MKNYIKLIIKFFCVFLKLRYVESITTYPILKSNHFSSLKNAKIIKSQSSVRKYVVEILATSYEDNFNISQGVTFMKIY